MQTFAVGKIIVNCACFLITQLLINIIYIDAFYIKLKLNISAID